LYKSSYIFANNPSIYLQTSFGKKINNDFWLSLDLIKVNARGEFESNIFVDRTSSYNAFIVIPNFTKDFEFKSFCFSPSLGLLLIHESAKFPDLSGNSESPLTIRNQKENTFGLYLNLVLKKELNKNLILGLNVKSYVIINLEIETFMIGPSVEIRL
jgi:hypothetical protein